MTTSQVTSAASGLFSFKAAISAAYAAYARPRPMPDGHDEL